MTEAYKTIAIVLLAAISCSCLDIGSATGNAYALAAAILTGGAGGYLGWKWRA